MAIRYFTISNPQYFRSHQWRFCTRQFFKQNWFPTDATTWIKVNGTRTVHVQGVNIFLFSHTAYQQYSYLCIANFGLTSSTSMSEISSTEGVYEDGVSVKIFPRTFCNSPKLDWSCTVNVRHTTGDQRTHLAIDILLCETYNTSDLTSGDFEQGSFSNKIGHSPWMKVNGTRTVHVQGLNIFLSYCLSAI